MRQNKQKTFTFIAHLEVRAVSAKQRNKYDNLIRVQIET